MMQLRLGLLAIAIAASPLAAQNATHLHIVGNDYAFIHPPDTVNPGPTQFSFENQGKVRHELSIGLLRPGAGMREVLDTYTNGGRRRDLMTSTIGILLAFPADTGGGRLLANLLPGRTYLIVCGLRDTPEAQPHFTMGMINVLVVRDRAR